MDTPASPASPKTFRGRSRLTIDHKSWILAVLVFLLELNAGQAQSGDGLSHFFSPVSDPVKVDAVPPSMSKVVQLATTLTGGQLPSPGTQDDTRYDSSPAEWSVPEDDTTVTHIHDNFDPSTPSMWEQISGGTVTDRCDAVSGKALCFDGVGGRFAITAPVNTLSGGVVRFSIHLAFEDGVAAPIVLEYKSIGRPWMVLETYKESTYAESGFENPNAKSLGMVNAGGVNGFVIYAVHLPVEANSAATKFRWRQLREQVSGTLATWAVDDITIDIDNLNPAVQLSAPYQGGGARSVLTVVVQFSQQVQGFEMEDIQIQNGTVASLSIFNAKILGIGAVYTCLVKPAGEGSQYNIVLKVPSHACMNKNGHPNLGSNILTIDYNAQARAKSRGDVALGPRPGPADASEAAAWNRPELGGGGGGIKPLKPGQQINPIGKSFNITELVQDPMAVARKLEEAENMYRRISERGQKPPQVILDKLEKEIKSLKAVQKRMMAMDEMEGITGRQYGYSEMDAELHHEMDVLRKEREDMSRAMEAQKAMRDELLKEREALKAEREEAAREAKLQQEELKKLLDDQKHEIEDIIAEEHKHSHHGHKHKHKHKDVHKDHVSGDEAQGQSYANDQVICDDETGTCTLQSMMHDDHDHDHDHDDDYYDDDHDMHEEMVDIAREEVSKILKSEVSAEKEEIRKEKEALAAEKERHRAEMEAETKRREEFAEEQQKMMTELMAEQRRLRTEAARLSMLHEEHEKDIEEHEKHEHEDTKQEQVDETEVTVKETDALQAERDKLMAELEAEREQRKQFAEQQQSMFDALMAEQRKLRMEMMQAAKKEQQEEEEEEEEEEDKGPRDSKEDRDKEFETEKQKFEAEKAELEAARIALIEERERAAAAAEQALVEEKERMRLKAEADEIERNREREEQKKFMEELMMQTRLLMAQQMRANAATENETEAVE
mmetsp:Transcript_17212/g.20708  ORF Transcript_17212/g.20708 Transcript_17212/m.20708 type:complete len:950 (+) Transcript_17212:195-3044(+)|eukprot:CAMPEP_0197855726 /NCGR_PEP_ID=MMETSP1438-20131217/27168_1 /TAXON_ID=1461541 /ORGANISM="Pterosperma sp., Strain CCMP1384" /LENGTH=949 /DNA_ID=CAMNT_0043470949 /DNA_START=189 /DNA_END=3038 /DNA_ORIENTATION=-